jgi:4-amino-4-deoxy-L-arabinose transferase-like glycosyltransferase
VLLPGLILVCWHGANREWRPLLALAPLSLVSVVVVAPWYVLLVDRIGIETVVREVWAQNFDRFGNTARGHGNKGLIYYPSRLAADFLPWVLLLGPALWALGREWRNDRTARLLLIWILVPLVFFTIASTKRNVYLVPLYPALAAVVAWWLLRCGPGGWQALVERGLRPVMAIAGAGLVAAAAMAPWLPAPEAVPVELITALRPGLVVVGLTLLAGALWPRGPATDPVGRWRWIGGTMVAGWAGALWLVIPAFDPMRSYRPAALDIVGMVPPGEAVGFFAPGWEKTKRPAWLCHLDGRRLAIHGSTTAALAWLRSDPGRVMLTRPRHVPGDLPAVVVERTWRISSDGWALVRSATSATAP